MNTSKNLMTAIQVMSFLVIVMDGYGVLDNLMNHRLDTWTANKYIQYGCMIAIFFLARTYSKNNLPGVKNTSICNNIIIGLSCLNFVLLMVYITCHLHQKDSHCAYVISALYAFSFIVLSSTEAYLNNQRPSSAIIMSQITPSTMIPVGERS